MIQGDYTHWYIPLFLCLSRWGEVLTAMHSMFFNSLKSFSILSLKHLSSRTKTESLSISVHSSSQVPQKKAYPFCCPCCLLLKNCPIPVSYTHIYRQRISLSAVPIFHLFLQKDRVLHCWPDSKDPTEWKRLYQKANTIAKAEVHCWYS